MKFENVVKSVRTRAEAADVSDVHEKVAIQVTLTGKDEGIFYIEINDGAIAVEPYEYIDRSAEIIMTNENFCKMLNGKLDPIAGFTLGKIKVNGDLTNALVIGKLLK